MKPCKCSTRSKQISISKNCLTLFVTKIGRSRCFSVAATKPYQFKVRINTVRSASRVQHGTTQKNCRTLIKLSNQIKRAQRALRSKLLGNRQLKSSAIIPKKYHKLIVLPMRVFVTHSIDLCKRVKSFRSLRQQEFRLFDQTSCKQISIVNSSSCFLGRVLVQAANLKPQKGQSRSLA